MALFNVVSRRKQPQTDFDLVQQQLLALMNPQIAQAAGPVQPGGLPPVLDETLLAPQRLTELASTLSSGQQTQGVGNQLLQQLIGQVLPPQAQDPTTLARNLEAAGLQPGTEEFQSAMLNILQKPTVSISQGDKFLGESAKNWLNPDTGEKASPTDTILSATSKGLRPVTTEEAKSAGTGKAAAPIVGRLINAGFGKKGQKSLFPPISEGIIERGLSGVQSRIANIAQSDERTVLYNSMKDSFVTQLARLSGQVGTLTDRDVGLVRDLLPTIGFTPEPTARSQMKQIVGILQSKGVPEKTLKAFGLPDWAFEQNGEAPPPPPGFRID